jgi:hypothetical protein
MMKTRTPATKAVAKTTKDLRDLNLLMDGKWRSFPKVPNLLQYVGTGTFYGRATVDGKIYRESLETAVYSVAKQKLPMQMSRCWPATFISVARGANGRETNSPRNRDFISHRKAES